jgi:hypothetical protein
VVGRREYNNVRRNRLNQIKAVTKLINITNKVQFPHDNMLARYVMGLAIIHNQLVLIRKSNLLLMKKDEMSFLTEESFISFSMMSALLREAIRYLQHTFNEPEVSNFIESLPDKLQVKYEYLCGMFDEDINIYKRITKMRNATFHFAKPNDKDNKDLENVLRDQKDSSILYSDEMEYFNFAIGISNHILLRSMISQEEIEKENYEVLNKAMNRIRETSSQLIIFSNETVKYYLKNF